MSTQIGTELAGYRIEQLLGRGGMSVVYLAEHVQLGRKVALKVLSPGLAHDETFRERFIRESRLAASIDHPNIIPIYDAGESDGFLYIAMRYVDGVDLKALVAQGALSLGRTAFIIEQVTGALDAAHERGLVHRDVKPGNILIANATDRVYLSDFGVVKHSGSSGLTQTGYFLGTVDYAAPEQIEGRPVDARTDVYAVGCVLYECLTGVAPFKKDTEVAVMHAHLVEPPPKPTAVNPELPSSLNTVVATAMAKSQDDRYDTPGQLVAGLRAAALGRSLSEHGPAAFETARAVPETAVQPAGASQPSPPAAAPPPPPAPPPAPPPVSAEAPPPGPRSRRLRPALLAAIVAGIVLLAAGVAIPLFLVLRDDGGKQSKATTMGGMGKPSASSPLLKALPQPIAKTCTKKLSGQAGALEGRSCMMDEPKLGRTEQMSFFLFPSAKAMNTAYDRAIRGTGIPRNSGGCSAVNWGGEGTWTHEKAMGKGGGMQMGGGGTANGRRSCFLRGGKPQIVWTDTHTKILSMATGERHPALYSWWAFWHHQI